MNAFVLDMLNTSLIYMFTLIGTIYMFTLIGTFS